jgi:hypothetical protein
LGRERYPNGQLCELILTETDASRRQWQMFPPPVRSRGLTTAQLGGEYRRIMAKTRYPSFPPCCQKVLDDLERENRKGTRNCEKGHFVSVEHAQSVEAAAARKLAAEAAAPPSSAAKD